MKTKWIILGICVLAATAFALCYLYFFKEAPSAIEGVLV